MTVYIKNPNESMKITRINYQGHRVQKKPN